MGEPTSEHKAILGFTRQALEIALKKTTFRWLFCWNGSEDPNSGFDCSCCITWDDAVRDCGCVCHKRFREIEALFYAVMDARRINATSWWWNRDVDGALVSRMKELEAVQDDDTN